MIRFKTSRLTVAVAVAATVVVVAGGLATASNMGFKLNKVLISFTATPAAGDNYLSLPYNNPYGTYNGLCTQTGLRSVAPRARITYIDQNNNVPQNFDCGLAGSNVALPSDGAGIRIRQSGAVPSPYILVGSHNTGKTIDIKKFCLNNTQVGCGAAPATGSGEFFVSVPYHTTAVTFADLCTSLGLTTGAAGALMTRINPGDNVPQSARCGLAGAAGINLVLGEAVRIREPNARNGLRMAHF